MPYLMRAHAFKDAEAKSKEVNVGTFDYPVLMAADILIQDADVVPVGQDQKQHLEMARDIAEKFNRLFGETFILPTPIIKEDVAIVPGVDGRKMSKSYGNTIPLFGNDEEIGKAVMSIVTDSKTPEDPKDPKTCNIFALHKLLAPIHSPILKKGIAKAVWGIRNPKRFSRRIFWRSFGQCAIGAMRSQATAGIYCAY